MGDKNYLLKKDIKNKIVVLKIGRVFLKKDYYKR